MIPTHRFFRPRSNQLRPGPVVLHPPQWSHGHVLVTGLPVVPLDWSKGNGGNPHMLLWKCWFPANCPWKIPGSMDDSIEILRSANIRHSWNGRHGIGWYWWIISMKPPATLVVYPLYFLTLPILIFKNRNPGVLSFFSPCWLQTQNLFEVPIRLACQAILGKGGCQLIRWV